MGTGECPNQSKGQATLASAPAAPQPVLAARAVRPREPELQTVPEADEWQLLVYATIGIAVNEIMWSMKELAYKIILDIGCMRSVAGLEWANSLFKRWRSEGRWCRVFKENEVWGWRGSVWFLGPVHRYSHVRDALKLGRSLSSSVSPSARRVRVWGGARQWTLHHVN